MVVAPELGNCGACYDGRLLPVTMPSISCRPILSLHDLVLMIVLTNDEPCGKGRRQSECCTIDGDSGANEKRCDAWQRGGKEGQAFLGNMPKS